MADVSQYTFYTMLYIKSNDTKQNMAENGFLNILGYINCCKVLNDSLKKFGYKLIILSNEPNFITDHEQSLTVSKVDFELDVPKRIKFFSAHHKIDIYKYLSLYGDKYSILLDNDIVCINNMPENMDVIIRNEIPMYYDITDQCYPAYGRRKLMDNKKAVMGCESIGNWTGGEFIGGNKHFFAEIYKNCMSFWDSYILKLGQIHHQGDEMLTSCSIEKYILEGNRIFNAGSIGFIGRYWSVKTLHIGKPFEAFVDNFLLHLPADKEFLAMYKNNDDKTFVKEYQRYLMNKSKKTTRVISFVKKCINKGLKILGVRKNST